MMPVKISRRSFMKSSFAILMGVLGNQGSVIAGDRQEFKEFDVVMERYKYTPSIIRVNRGDRVRINLRSTDVLHGFYISGYDLDAWVHRKEPKTLEFTADKVGVFTIKCSVICGPMHPVMQGKLVVEPNYPSWFALILGFLVPFSVLGYLYRKRMGKGG
jgi:cytochrome c oxidase subunit 2